MMRKITRIGKALAGIILSTFLWLILLHGLRRNRRKTRKASASAKAIRGWKKLAAILLFCAAAAAANSFLSTATVSGSSMCPTLRDGDVCIVKKYDIQPERYDIVTASADGFPVVKRVIGMPGDTLEAAGGTVLINGSPVDAEYDFYTEDGGVLDEPYTLGENEYFLMGDNRQGSSDSRAYGSVPSDRIRGVLVCRIFPLNEIKKFD